MKLRTISLALVLSGILTCTTACLKTRAQLREDADSDTSQSTAPKPIPGQIQNVQEAQPQGQYALDEVKGEITRLEGRLEDLEHTQKDAATQNQANGAAKDDMKKLEQRIIELEEAQANMLEAIKKLQATPATPADAAQLLTQAKAEFDAGNYEGATHELDAYLKNPKAAKVQEAAFLRAECHFNLKEYKKAIVDYSKFPEKFTTSKRMPAALYKIGLSFDALGMHDDAKGFYQELLDKFPHSPEAKKAKGKAK